jgi:hypothetical protein
MGPEHPGEKKNGRPAGGGPAVAAFGQDEGAA